MDKEWHKVVAIVILFAAFILSFFLIAALFAGTTTSSLGLYKPTSNSETGWGDLVNTNFDTLDAAIPDKRNTASISGAWTFGGNTTFNSQVTATNNIILSNKKLIVPSSDSSQLMILSTTTSQNNTLILEKQEDGLRISQICLESCNAFSQGGACPSTAENFMCWGRNDSTGQGDFTFGTSTSVLANHGGTDKLNITIGNAANDTTLILTSTTANFQGVKLGVGITPTVSLDVAGTVRSSSRYLLDNGAQDVYEVGVTSAGNNGLSILDVKTGNYMMKVTDIGRIGISTTSPGWLLDVAYINTSTNSGDANLVLSQSDTFGADKGSRLGFAGKTGSGNSLSIFANIAGRKENATDGNSAGYLQFATRTGSADTEKARITSTGNFGIGTANPQQKLDVSSGTAHFSGSGSPTTGQALCLDAAGNLGHCTSAVGAGGACTCSSP